MNARRVAFHRQYSRHFVRGRKKKQFAAKKKGVPFLTIRVPQSFGQWLDKVTVERIYGRAHTLMTQEIMIHPPSL